MSTVTITPYYKPHRKQMMLHNSPTSFEDLSITLFGGGRGPGKAQPLDEPILTPVGFKAMGEMKIGTVLCSPSGGQTRVIQIHPQGVMATYKVTFIDGGSTRVTGQHLWNASVSCRYPHYKIMDTLEMKRLVDKGKNVLIPLTEPVAFARGRDSILIKPYTLGALLGDGCLTKETIEISSGDPEIIRNIENDGYNVGKLRGKFSYTLHVDPAFRKYLKSHKLNVTAKYKHIPFGYLNADPQTRLEVLRGLMDTDGTADKQGSVSFCTISERLAKDVQYLVWSLGGKATISTKRPFFKDANGEKKEGELAYIVYIAIQEREKLFKLSRKKARCKTNNGGASTLKRKIKSIEYIGEELCQCITVDRPDGLYITKDFIVTHNSAGILMDAFFFATTYPGAKCAIFRERLDAVKQSFLDKLPTLIPEKAKGVTLYEYKEKGSTYPSRSIVLPNGSYITLQRASSYAEALCYRGYEFHYLAIDEATLLEERALDFLLTCVRSAKVFNKYTGKLLSIPTKIVYGCNPGGISHKYIKEKYIDTTVTKYDPITRTPLETKDHVEYITNPLDPSRKIKRNIRFIPATYKDNPYLAPSYVANLLAQPQHLIERDLHGNWDVVAGRMFNLTEDQKIDSRVAMSAFNYNSPRVDVYISIDWGYKPSYHTAQWWAVMDDKRAICFKEIYGQELIFEDFVAEIVEQSKNMTISATLLPHDLFRHGDRYKDNAGRIIGETKADVFEHYGLCPIGVESGKGKVEMRFDKIHSAMEIKQPDDVYKFRIAKSCENLIEELENAVYSDTEVGVIAKACKDHAIDAFGLFLIFYSDDICPIELEQKQVDNRGRIQRLIEEEEKQLEENEENENFAIANYFDMW